MKKKLLLTFMVLMSAMTMWAGQVFLDPSCFANGNVVATPTTANAGDNVTLTVTPAMGYWIWAYVDPYDANPPTDVLMVQETDQYGNPTSTPAFYVGDVNNQGVDWSAASPGTFTFMMPPTGYAKVTATFGLQAYPVNANNTIYSSMNWVTNGNPNPPGHARMGDIITITSTISGGYVLDDYLVMAHYSGYDVRIPVTSGQFVMPPAFVDIYAIYKLPGSYLVYPDPIENTPFAIHTIPEHYGSSRIPCAMPGETVFLDLASIEGLDDIQVVGLSSGTIVPVYYKDLHYSFDMPAEDVEVTVTNQPPTGLPHDVFLHSNTGGTVRIIPTTYLPAIEHAHIDMDIEPRAGYFVDNVSTDLLSGGPVLLYPRSMDANGTLHYTIEMSDHDVNVTVTFTAGNGYQVIVGPTTNGTVVSDYTNAMPHDRVTLTMTPNPGYMVAPGSVIVTERNPPYNQVFVFNGNNPDEYCFYMPSSDVDVTATFVLSSLVPYDVYTDPTTVNGIVEVVSIDGVTIPPGTPQPYTANAGVQVVVNDMPDPGYRLDFYELLDMSYVPLQTFTTNTFQMLPQDVIVSAKFVQNDYKVGVQSSQRGIADAWWNGIQLYDPVTNTYTPVHYLDVIELTCTPNPGYELDPGDPYRIYDGSIDITATVGLAWVGPGPNDYVFSMPASDVRVVPNYRLATFNVFVDQAIPGGIMDAYDRSNGQGGPFIQTFLATATDRIELSNTPNPPNSIAYYTVYDGGGSYIGDLLDFNPTVFTMPPFDIQLTALFCAPPLPQPNNPIHLWTSYNGPINWRGTIYLHEMYMTKSGRSGMWDRPENYGWSSAGPGELMYFTVVPDLGCQVKKSDITVQLVALTTIPGIMEEGECIDITDINGPDDYVTEATDFSFIFAVPEGVNPGFVEVRIYADFDPVDYYIAVDMDAIEHGTVVAPDVAHVDETVTLTVTPDPGYRLESITVTPEDPGFFVPVDENQFVMPACNVTVTATFEESDHLVGDMNDDGLVNVTDVTLLINAVLNENYDIVSEEYADINDDGIINITDVTILISRVLNN